MNAAAYALRFGATFLLLWLALEVLRASPIEPALLREMFLDVAASLLGLFGGQVDVAGRALVSADVHLRIVRGCEGAEALVLTAAAVLALPRVTQRERAVALACALLLGWLLCVVRLLLLFLTLQHWPEHWEPMHGLVSPLLPVLVLLLAFHSWTRRVASRAGETFHDDR